MNKNRKRLKQLCKGAMVFALSTAMVFNTVPAWATETTQSGQKKQTRVEDTGFDNVKVGQSITVNGVTTAPSGNSMTDGSMTSEQQKEHACQMAANNIHGIFENLDTLSEEGYYNDSTGIYTFVQSKILNPVQADSLVKELEDCDADAIGAFLVNTTATTETLAAKTPTGVISKFPQKVSDEIMTLGYVPEGAKTETGGGSADKKYVLSTKPDGSYEFAEKNVTTVIGTSDQVTASKTASDIPFTPTVSSTGFAREWYTVMQDEQIAYKPNQWDWTITGPSNQALPANIHKEDWSAKNPDAAEYNKTTYTNHYKRYVEKVVSQWINAWQLKYDQEYVPGNANIPWKDIYTAMDKICSNSLTKSVHVTEVVDCKLADVKVGTEINTKHDDDPDKSITWQVYRTVDDTPDGEIEDGTLRVFKGDEDGRITLSFSEPGVYFLDEYEPIVCSAGNTYTWTEVHTIIEDVTGNVIARWSETKSGSALYAENIKYTPRVYRVRQEVGEDEAGEPWIVSPDKITIGAQTYQVK